MTFDLYAWQAPRTDDEEAAGRLLRRHARGESVFHADAPQLLAFVGDLQAAADRGRWPWEGVEVERGLASMSFSFSVTDEALEAVVALAERHDVVLYDPQGPTVHWPVSDAPAPPEGTLAQVAGTVRTLVIGAVLVAFGWWLPIPLLGWLPMLAGALFLLFGVLEAVSFIVPSRRAR